MARDDFQQALINRSLRNVKLELEFLADAKIITSGQLHEIISALPESASSTTTTTASTTRNPLTNAASALPTLPLRNNSTPQPNGHTTNNTNATIPQSYNEKQNGFHNNAAQTPPVTTNAPPPAYPTAPAPPLASATALYQYNAQDAGDLQLAPNDRVAVTEYMNAEWWKGRNERTGQEGIFPRSYVKVEEKALQQQQQGGGGQQGSGYGNMPLDVSQSGGAGGKEGNAEPSKVEQNGKKFGKKLGNAAIFGAGATIGGKIVNGIF